MFNKDKIISILEEEGLNDIEVLKEENGLFVLRFFYDFDDAEIEASKSFAEDGAEYTLEDEEIREEIKKEYIEEKIEDENEATKELIEEGLNYDDEEESELNLSPEKVYLQDIAIDFVGDLLEDIMEEEEINIQYIGYDIEESLESYEFVGLFYDKNKEADIDEILDEMEI